MGLITLYNVASPLPAAELRERMSPELLEPQQLVASEAREHDDDSQLLRLEDAEQELYFGAWVVPVPEGQFQPAPFDDNAGRDADWASTIQCICKIGTQESPDPSVAVRKGLALAADLAEGEGRIYDSHADQVLDAEQARALADEPFEIRRFVSYHYMTPPSGDQEHSWLHVHGMVKFFSPDLEAFDVHPDVSHKALTLLMHIAADAAQGGTLATDVPTPYGHGAYKLRLGEEVRPTLVHFTGEDFDADHAGPSLVVEDAGTYQSLDKLLRGAYELEPKTREECEAEQQVWQGMLDGVRRAWNAQPGGVILRAALKVGQLEALEHIWVEPTTWAKNGKMDGKLLNDAFADPSMIRGTPVQFEEGSISGMSAVQEGAVLDEIESLRTVDPAAAELLDKALEPVGDEPRRQESSSPDGQVIARFEDDGQVGVLQLLDAVDTKPLCEPIWLYNRHRTPPIIDARRPTQLGRTPMLSAVYTSQRSAMEVPKSPKVELTWEGERVRLTLDDELWGVADAGAGRGWSKLIALTCRYGAPLADAGTSAEPPTIRTQSPFESGE